MKDAMVRKQKIRVKTLMLLSIFLTVTVGFTAIVGAAAVAAAIAFGIGGRNTAAHVLDKVTKSLEADTSALD